MLFSFNLLFKVIVEMLFSFSLLFKVIFLSKGWGLFWNILYQQHMNALRETIKKHKLFNQFNLIIQHANWATDFRGFKRKIFKPRCFLFQFWSITYSTRVCNFTNERKLSVSWGGSGFPIWYIVIVENEGGQTSSGEEGRSWGVGLLMGVPSVDCLSLHKVC